ncbi:MAG: uracil-DNA glycosylase [Gammaproteobacteria bacterium]|nr:uracil-DNA glycosylase [Gammaproteobacteria bacterium]
MNACQQCQLCPLHSTRTQTVFGTGHKHAELMIIGEAPGFYEDQQGEPFVGRAGKLLNAMLHSIGFSRRDVYIANILKCRPPNNRDPLPQEVSACTSYLEQQIALVQPKVLCALGRIAGHYLLQTTEPLNRLRHKKHVYGADNRRLFITYHPAYLLRNPLAKAEAYRDLLQLKECL